MSLENMSKESLDNLKKFGEHERFMGLIIAIFASPIFGGVVTAGVGLALLIDGDIRVANAKEQQKKL